MRRNPPVADLIPEVKRALRGREAVIKKHFGVDVLKRQKKACGRFGCVFERDGSTVLKVTTDPNEVKMVREIIRLRKLPARVTPSTVKYFASLGTTPQKASKLPGIVGYYSAPVKIKAGAWSYVREAVKPLDAMKGPDARRRLIFLGAELERFYYEAKHPTAAALIKRKPEMAAIVQTTEYLKRVLGIRMEDVHEEQSAVVTKTTALHKAGTLVLFDGQFD